MERSANGSSMKLTDMNFDCLESCFRHLSIEELLNVADSNRQMRYAARHVFRLMHGRKLVCLYNLLQFQKEDQRLRLYDGILRISELKLGLQFLRCFGDLVFEMKVSVSYLLPIGGASFIKSLTTKESQIRYKHRYQYVKSHEWEDLIIEYVNEYCTESLEKIQFWWGRRNSDIFNKLTKPFDNVETLKINTFFLTEKKLHEFFPKVRELEVRWRITRDSYPCHTNFLTNHFPYLKHLSFERANKINFDKKGLEIALRLNPQIKSLRGNVWFDVLFDTKYIWNANEHFQNLEILDLFVRSSENPEKIKIFNKPISEHIHLKNLRELNVSIYDEMVGESSWTIPIHCDNLESFNFSASSYFKIEHVCNLFDKYPTVKKFQFRFNERRFDSRILKVFPLLEELFLQNYDNLLAPDEIVGLIENFHSLKLFKFYWPFKRIVEIDRLKPLLSCWSISNKTKCEYLKIQTIEMKRKN